MIRQGYRLLGKAVFNGKNHRILPWLSLGLASLCPGQDQSPPAELVPAQLEEEKGGHLFDRLGVLIPSGYTGEIRAGYRFNRTTQRENGMTLRLRAARQRDKYTMEASGYYEYARIRSAEDEVSTLTDRYGAATAFEYTVQPPFFLRAQAEWSVNRIKGIERQIDLTALLGARVIDREKMRLSLAAGSGAQNQKLRDEQGEWEQQAVFQEKFERQLNSFLRIEQQFAVAGNVEDFDDYDTVFSALVRVKLADWADALLRYSNEYTSIVAEDAPRREELLVLELSIPF